MKLRTVAPSLPLIFLAACAPEPVNLQSMTGEMVQCGADNAHLGFFIGKGHETDAELRARCIAGYEARGFHRVEPPAPQR